MRMTVEEVIKELQECDPKTPVRVQIYYNGYELNGILRIDKLLGKTLIVVQDEIN